MADIVPAHADCYAEKEAKGDLIMRTDVETWNACLLNALALPALPRLGLCPPDLQLREGLASIPMYDETYFYKLSDSRGAAPAASASSSPGEVVDTSHLKTPLTRSELLHISRRIGFSPKSLNLEAHLNGSKPALTLQQVIQRALAPENTQLGYNGKWVRPPKVYANFLKRSNVAVNLWSSERREKRNNWKDVLRIPYPRYDTIQRRLKRWSLEKFFDMSSLFVNPENEVDGSLQVHASYNGREEEILDQLTANATVFYRAPAISLSEGTRIVGSMLDEDGKVKDPSLIDWYQTVMQATDVKETVTITMEKVIDDWRCDAASRTHPEDASVPCDPACDLSGLLTIDYAAETAMLTDTSDRGPDNSRFTAPWYLLRECVRADSARKTFEVNRYNHFKNAVRGDLWDLLFTDFTSPQYGLRARMIFFFLNLYATPSTNVNDDLLMYKQYQTIFEGALGNWR